MASKRISPFNAVLVFITSKEQFDKIQADKPRRPKTSLTKNQQQVQAYKQQVKQDIVIPKCGKIPNIEQFKFLKPKCRQKLQCNGYLRLKTQHNLPNPSIYQMTEQDHAVLNYLKQKYIFPQQTEFQLQQKHMTLIFKLCQEFSQSRDLQILQMLSDKNTMSEYVANYLGESFALEQRQMVSKLVCELFDYWRIIKKDNANFPLMRKFWPKQFTSFSNTNVWIPFKSRTPGIIDPKPFSNQLKTIGVKPNKTEYNWRNKVISSFDQWNVFYNVHRTKKKHFQKCVKNFHSLADSYGFKCPFEIKTISKQKLNLSEKLLLDEKSKQSSSQEHSILNKSHNRKWKLKNSDLNKNSTFKSVTEWLRYQKKILRKERRLNQQSISEQKIQAPSEIIQILDDVEVNDEQISFIQKSQFQDSTFIEVEKELGDQAIFTFVIKQEHDSDQEYDSMLGSENFYSNLDFSNIGQLDGFSFQKLDEEDTKIQQAARNICKVSELQSSGTTVYEQQLQSLEKVKSSRSKSKRKSFKKKIKRN